MPKPITIVLLSSLVFVLTASFQCDKPCVPISPERQSSKTWLPLQQKNELIFKSSNGAMVAFSYNESDTLILFNYPSCGMDRIDRVMATLSLDAGKDSIRLHLDAPSTFDLRAGLAGLKEVIFYGIISSAGQTPFLQRLSNFPVGGRTYPDVLLVKTTPEVSPRLDSLYLANGSGIVGFNYKGVSYTLP